MVIYISQHGSCRSHSNNVFHFCPPFQFSNKYVSSMVHAFQKVGKGISYTSINFKNNLK